MDNNAQVTGNKYALALFSLLLQTKPTCILVSLGIKKQTQNISEVPAQNTNHILSCLLGAVLTKITVTSFVPSCQLLCLIPNLISNHSI